MKGFIILIVVISAFFITGTMDYKDALAKQNGVKPQEREIYVVAERWPSLVLKKIENIW